MSAGTASKTHSTYTALLTCPFISMSDRRTEWENGSEQPSTSRTSGSLTTVYSGPITGESGRACALKSSVTEAGIRAIFRFSMLKATHCEVATPTLVGSPPPLPTLVSSQSRRAATLPCASNHVFTFTCSPQRGYRSTMMCMRAHTHPRFSADMPGGMALPIPHSPWAWLQAHSWTMVATVFIVVRWSGPTSSKRTGKVS
mmetsp:Transcript_13746/g.22495  ORF Transcript_13746/g.22495 Transcript_13746/m.22495 type:complete len:200 (+) Transcript_13746:775-1374(+)